MSRDRPNRIAIDEPLALRRVVERLCIRFPEQSGPTVKAVVDACYAKYHSSPIRTFIPILVDKAARAKLSAVSADLAA